MKKRLLAMILSALLVVNISACSDVIDNDFDKETNNTVTVESNDRESLVTENTKLYTTKELADVLQLPDHFVSVLKNETKVYYDLDKEYLYLQHWFLGPVMSFAFVSAIDLDEDGIKDIVTLDGNDGTMVILKAYEGTVHAEFVGSRYIWGLKIDGTFFSRDRLYDDTGDYNRVYTCRYQFSEGEIIRTVLCRSEYGENCQRYYINEAEVSQEEYLAYEPHQNSVKDAERYGWNTNFTPSEQWFDGK